MVKSTNFFIKMKLLLVLAAVFGVTVAAEDEYCFNDVVGACKPAGGGFDLNHCNARYGAISSSEYDLQSFANKHITHSFQYLLLSSHFGNYEKQRTGFSKLFRKLSDTAWNDGIELIKYVTKRGGVMDFKSKRQDDTLVETQNDTYELYELESLAMAIDIQKSLANEANRIHSQVVEDGEIQSHVENNYVHKLRDSIRELSGHTNDLKNLLSSSKQNSLHVYLFDEYLQKMY